MSRTTIVLLVVLAIFFILNAFAEDCKGENEEYDCRSACQTTCINLNEPCPVVNVRCNNDCYCKGGYVRRYGYNSSCIAVSDCEVI